MKYITDWKDSDKDVEYYLLKNKGEYDEQVTQVRYLISEIKSNHCNTVLSKRCFRNPKEGKSY